MMYSRLEENSKIDVSIGFRPPYWCPSKGHQQLHGVSIQNFVNLGKTYYSIHTEIFAPKINEINFIPVRDCWLLISRTVFVTSEKYRPTNHRPRTALCH